MAKIKLETTFEFLRTEIASAAALAFATLAALVVANSPWADAYFGWLKSEHLLQIGPLGLTESVSGWIKEGLMAVFFLVVGLEIKYEILRGELREPAKLAMPVFAALGGMIAPAAVYLAIAAARGGPMNGWPVPLATDIAFALGVFAVAGRGLPPSLRVFLLTLAIVDDLGAIGLIAVLFSKGVDWPLLAGVAGLLAAGGLAAARRRIPAPLWILGFLLVWGLTVRSGLSTSLTAVAFAAIVPVRERREDAQSPLKQAMHDLHPWVAWLILPLFAFAKAGVSFDGLSPAQLAAPLVVGVALGLWIGKQVGVFGAAWLAARLGLGRPPSGASWLELYGVSLLCGVGFTMSLFIGALAFPGAIDSAEQVEVRLGVLAGSLLSAATGSVVLAVAARRRKDLAETSMDTGES